MTDAKLNELLETEKTPLYLFDIDKLQKRVKFLKASLPDTVELCYAVKANTFIARELSELVDFFEICSPGEYRICERENLSYEKFVISGVNKEPDFIKSIIAASRSIAYFTVESTSQFRLLHDTAKVCQKKTPVLLRATSGNQFGLDKSDLLDIINRYKDDLWIDICGIQYFSGTQKTSLKKLHREIQYLDNLISELEESFNFNVRKLEYGPGFPVSYFEGEEFDEIEFLNEFSNLICNMKYSSAISLELGRSIAASCGTYLTSVVDTKSNNSELYAIVDGGMHQIVYYGQSMAMKHPKIRLLSSREKGKLQNWNICGSLCTVNDFLVKRFPLPELDAGDVLAFENTGAYCVTEGISLFLSREIPSVFLAYEDGNFIKVRKHTKTEIFNAPQTKETEIF